MVLECKGVGILLVVGAYSLRFKISNQTILRQHGCDIDISTTAKLQQIAEKDLASDRT